MEEDTKYTDLIYDLELQFEMFLKWYIFRENEPNNSWLRTKIHAV
jgi:hypothetical protein